MRWNVGRPAWSYARWITLLSGADGNPCARDEPVILSEARRQISCRPEINKFLRLTMERVLVRAGYEVCSAGDGEEALRSPQVKLPDLILLISC